MDFYLIDNRVSTNYILTKNKIVCQSISEHNILYEEIIRNMYDQEVVGATDLKKIKGKAEKSRSVVTGGS